MVAFMKAEDLRKGAILCSDDDDESIQSEDYRAALYRASSLSGLSDSASENEVRKQRGRSARRARASLQQESQTELRRKRQSNLLVAARGSSRSRSSHGSRERSTSRSRRSSRSSDADESRDGRTSRERSASKTRTSVKKIAQKRESRRTRTPSLLGGSDFSEQADDDEGRSQSMSANPPCQLKRANSTKAPRRNNLSRSLSMEINERDRMADNGQGKGGNSRAASLRANKSCHGSVSKSKKQSTSCKRLTRSLSMGVKPKENHASTEEVERRKQRNTSLRGEKAGSAHVHLKRSNSRRLSRSVSIENVTRDRSLSRTKSARSVEGRKGGRTARAIEQDRGLGSREHLDAEAEDNPGARHERKGSSKHEPTNRKTRSPKRRTLPRRISSNSQDRDQRLRSSSIARKAAEKTRALDRTQSKKSKSRLRSPPRRTLSDVISRTSKGRQGERADLSDASSHGNSSTRSSWRQRRRTGRRPSQREPAGASDSESTDDENRRRLPRRTFSAQERKNDAIAKETALLDQVAPSSFPCRTRNFRRRSYKDRCRTQIVSLSERLTADFEDTDSEEEDILSFEYFADAAASTTKEKDTETEQPHPTTIGSLLARGRLAATLATTASSLASSAGSVATNSLTMASSAATATAQTTFNLASTAGNTTMNLATTAMTSGFGVVKLDAMKGTTFPGTGGKHARDTPEGPPVSLSVLPTAA